MLVYTVALWGIGLGGGYALGLEGVGASSPMGAAGFWLAGVASLVVASTILLAYFARVSRAPAPG
jgi:MATE family multidrug resistance protein